MGVCLFTSRYAGATIFSDLPYIRMVLNITTVAKFSFRRRNHINQINLVVFVGKGTCQLSTCHIRRRAMLERKPDQPKS